MKYCHILTFLALLGLQSGETSGQWLNYPAKGQPRTRDGKVDLKARAPRTRDGKPDLSGVWRVESTSIEEWRVYHLDESWHLLPDNCHYR